MRFTPSVLLDAPEYYVDHLNGKHDVDKCTILRNLQLETDTESMPSSLKRLSKPTHILDLTNNELVAIPDLRDRSDIHTVLLSRNQITATNGRLLPGRIRNLVVANNNISTLEQLNGLKNAPGSLETLVLRGNQVCHLQGYREHVLRAVPNLTVLDFERVTQEERVRSRETQEIDIASEAVATGVKRDKSLEIADLVVSKMSEERKNELKAQLASATSLAEIARIEKLLAGGV
ncbi:hypothetical protein HG536_0E05490 [Torulaspora globosa]|uniref:U2 small nuclear ribonucleoprotein A' n=1 Tax=Torulaspora globosa TaxID=48254 RepID=A0A7G3ZJF2_9SACH|nr:uncharacterized protein HG536_0E05490 [Torulaspora globosa]QLL33638.1 hypothetical protein HG536_0E05490 [Torulaspora globosa]